MLLLKYSELQFFTRSNTQSVTVSGSKIANILSLSSEIVHFLNYNSMVLETLRSLH